MISDILAGPAARFIACAVIITLALFLARHITRGLVRNMEISARRVLLRKLRKPFLNLVALGGTLLALQVTLPDWADKQLVKTVFNSFVIFFIASLALQAVSAMETILKRRLRADKIETIRDRRILTQTTVIRRIAMVVVVTVALAIFLIQFEPVRSFGTSLLASAGIAGIVLGLAAQKTLGNLIAGIQIAITQPIRVEDVVIVEGEWGQIEEITLTYVVVRIWDLRRIVVPISYFLDKPFQNWTRQNPDLLGTVFFYLDYTMPVARLRKMLDDAIESGEVKGWDGKVKVVQVTNLTDKCMEIRILLSAPDAGTAFDMRCMVREALISRLQDAYPDKLPRTRWETKPAANEDGGGNGNVSAAREAA